MGRLPWLSDPSPGLKAVLWAIGVLLGMMLKIMIESITSPVFDLQNIPYVTYISIFALFGVIVAYSVALWQAASKRIDETFSKVDALARRVGTRVTYVSARRGKPGAFFAMLEHYLLGAKQEILVLEYNLARRQIPGHEFDPEVRRSPESERYFKALSAKVKGSGPRGFRYQRIIQLQGNIPIVQALQKDTVFRDHCRAVAHASQDQEEYVSLMRCAPCFEGTYFLIDRRYMIWQVAHGDPGSHQYYTKGFFVFDDPYGDLIQQFTDHFHLFALHSSLVSSADLPLPAEGASEGGGEVQPNSRGAEAA